MAFSHAVSLDEALQTLKQKYSPCYEFARLLQFSWDHSAQVFIWWFEKFRCFHQNTNMGHTFSGFQTDIGTGFQELEQVGWIQSLTAIIGFPACCGTSQETAVTVIPFGFLMEVSLSRKGLEIPWNFYPWWKWTLAGLSNFPSVILGLLLLLSLSQVLRSHIPSKLL